MNAESEGEKMYLDKWRVAIRNLKNSLFSYPNTAQSCFPDPITDLYMAVKSSLTENSYAVLL